MHKKQWNQPEIKEINIKNTESGKDIHLHEEEYVGQKTGTIIYGWS